MPFRPATGSWLLATRVAGEERRLKIPSSRGSILRLTGKAIAEAAEVGGEVIWTMESTTGWARLKELIGSQVQLIMANILRSLPQSYQPTA